MAWYGLFFPTHHTAQTLVPQISTSLELSKMSSVGKKGLRVMTGLSQKYKSGGCEYKSQTGKRRRQTLLCLADTRLLKLMEIVQKDEVCTTDI